MIIKQEDFDKPVNPLLIPHEQRALQDRRKTIPKSSQPFLTNVQSTHKDACDPHHYTLVHNKTLN
jgi:hypothetical protein